MILILPNFSIPHGGNTSWEWETVTFDIPPPKLIILYTPIALYYVLMIMMLILIIIIKHNTVIIIHYLQYMICYLYNIWVMEMKIKYIQYRHLFNILEKFVFHKKYYICGYCTCTMRPSPLLSVPKFTVNLYCICSSVSQIYT